MKEPNNESALCIGVIEFLSQRRSEVLIPIAQPDVTDRQSEAVELVAESPTGRFVVEHTRIESFPKQIADGKAFSDLMDPLESTLPDVLPLGTYELIVAVGAASRVRRGDVLPVREAIQGWAIAKGSKLALGPDDDDALDVPWSISETPPGVPFEITLQRRPPDERSIVFVARFWPPDLERDRAARIETALQRKCPKLEAAKRQFGATSILILESDDIALANRHVVSETVMQSIQARANDVPDIILLVETNRGLAWQLWIVKEGDAMFPAIEKPGPFEICSPDNSLAELN